MSLEEKWEFFFFKKHGIEMGKAMGGLPLDMEDMPDFIKSEIEKFFLKNTSHCVKELDKSFPFVIEEDEKCVVCLDDINSCGRKCCLLYTSPSPRDKRQSRMPSSA